MSMVPDALAAQQHRQLLKLCGKNVLDQGGTRRRDHPARQGQTERAVGGTDTANCKQRPTSTAPVRGPTERRILMHMRRLHHTAMFLATEGSQGPARRWRKRLPWGSTTRPPAPPPAPAPPPQPEDSPSNSEENDTGGNLDRASYLRNLDGALLECRSPSLSSSTDSDLDVDTVFQTTASTVALQDNRGRCADQVLSAPPEQPSQCRQAGPVYWWLPQSKQQQQKQAREPRRLGLPICGSWQERELPALGRRSQSSAPPTEPARAAAGKGQQQQQQWQLTVSHWYPFGNLLNESDEEIEVEVEGPRVGEGPVTASEALATTTLADVYNGGATAAAAMAGCSGTSGRNSCSAELTPPSRPQTYLEPMAGPSTTTAAAATSPAPNAPSSDPSPMVLEPAAAASHASTVEEVLSSWFPMHRVVHGMYHELKGQGMQLHCQETLQAACKVIWDVWGIGQRTEPNRFEALSATPDLQAEDAQKRESVRRAARDAAHEADTRWQRQLQEMPLLWRLLLKRTWQDSTGCDVHLLLGILERTRPELLEVQTDWAKLAAVALGALGMEPRISTSGTGTRDPLDRLSREAPRPNRLNAHQVLHAAVLGLVLLTAPSEAEKDSSTTVDVLRAPRVYECAALGVLHMELSWVAAGKPAYYRWHCGVSPVQLYHILLFDTFVVARPEAVLRRGCADSDQNALVRPLDRFSHDYFAHLLSLLSDPGPGDQLLAQMSCSLLIRDWTFGIASKNMAVERLRVVLMDAERRRLQLRPGLGPLSCCFSMKQTTPQLAALQPATSANLHEATHATRTDHKRPPPHQGTQLPDQGQSQEADQKPQAQHKQLPPERPVLQRREAPEPVEAVERNGAESGAEMRQIVVVPPSPMYVSSISTTPPPSPPPLPSPSPPRPPAPASPPVPLPAAAYRHEYGSSRHRPGDEDCGEHRPIPKLGEAQKGGQFQLPMARHARTERRIDPDEPLTKSESHPQLPQPGFCGEGATPTWQAGQISFARELYAGLMWPNLSVPNGEPARDWVRCIMPSLRLAADHGLLDYQYTPDTQARVLHVLQDIASRDLRPVGSTAWLEAVQRGFALATMDMDFLGYHGRPEPCISTRGLLRAFVQGSLHEGRWAELVEEMRPGLIQAHARSWGRLLLRQQSTFFGWLRKKGSTATAQARQEEEEAAKRGASSSAASSAAVTAAVADLGTGLKPDQRHSLATLALWGLVVLRGVDMPLEFLSLACCLATGALRQELMLKTAADAKLAQGAAADLFRCLAFIPPLPYLPRDDAWTHAVLPAPPPLELPSGLPLHHPLRQQRMLEEIEYGIRLYLADPDISGLLAEQVMPPSMALADRAPSAVVLALLLEKWADRMEAVECDSEGGSSEGVEAWTGRWEKF